MTGLQTAADGRRYRVTRRAAPAPAPAPVGRLSPRVAPVIRANPGTFGRTGGEAVTADPTAGANGQGCRRPRQNTMARFNRDYPTRAKPEEFAHDALTHAQPRFGRPLVSSDPLNAPKRRRRRTPAS